MAFPPPFIVFMKSCHHPRLLTAVAALYSTFAVDVDLGQLNAESVAPPVAEVLLDEGTDGVDAVKTGTTAAVDAEGIMEPSA
jgi:hypothetical protein